MAGFTSSDPGQLILLQGTSILQCSAGVIGATVGVAADTTLMGVYIVANATAAVLTVGGFKDNTGAAANLIVSGSTTADYVWFPPAPALNYFAPFTFTPSIAGKIWLSLRAYVGPERPETKYTS